MQTPYLTVSNQLDINLIYKTSQVQKRVQNNKIIIETIIRFPTRRTNINTLILKLKPIIDHSNDQIKTQNSASKNFPKTPKITTHEIHHYILIYLLISLLVLLSIIFLLKRRHKQRQNTNSDHNLKTRYPENPILSTSQNSQKPSIHIV